MAKWQFFKGDYATMDEVRSEFRRLCLKLHPDKNPKEQAEHYTELFKEMTAEYEIFLEWFIPKANAYNEQKAKQENKDYWTTFTFEQESEIGKMIVKLMQFKGIIIDVCGTWLWLSGDTKPYKDRLGKNGLGFKWANQKQKWHWTPYEWKKKNHKVLPMEKIYELYGKYTIEVEERDAITA